jgi:hypothetical protein
MRIEIQTFPSAMENFKAAAQKLLSKEKAIIVPDDRRAQSAAFCWLFSEIGGISRFRVERN